MLIGPDPSGIWWTSFLWTFMTTNHFKVIPYEISWPLRHSSQIQPSTLRIGFHCSPPDPVSHEIRMSARPRECARATVLGAFGVTPLWPLFFLGVSVCKVGSLKNGGSWLACWFPLNHTPVSFRNPKWKPTQSGKPILSGIRRKDEF